MKLFAAACLALVTTSAANAATVVTSLTDFNAAIGSATTTTETFDNDIPADEVVLFDNGILSASTCCSPVNNLVSGGEFLGSIVGSGGNGAQSVLWTLPSPVIGLGFDLDSAPPFNFLGVQISIDRGATSFSLLEETGTLNSTFFGLVDPETPFDTVLFTSTEIVERNGGFAVDNLITATPVDMEVIPLPAGLPLLLAGLGTLAVIRARHALTRHRAAS